MTSPVTSEMRDLFQAMTKLENASEVEKYMRDVCTIAELGSIAERWAIAQKVNQGIPYRQIAKDLKTSTATITRVAQWVRSGEGGYRMMLDRCFPHHHDS